MIYVTIKNKLLKIIIHKPIETSNADMFNEYIRKEDTFNTKDASRLDVRVNDRRGRQRETRLATPRPDPGPRRSRDPGLAERLKPPPSLPPALDLGFLAEYRSCPGLHPTPKL